MRDANTTSAGPAPQPAWTVITGASSGIGRALAEAMARDGARLVLVARDHAALDDLSRALAQQWGTTSRTIAVDLSTAAGIAALTGQLEAAGLPVGTLVNNAGFGVHGPFAATALADELRLVELQVAALLSLTKTVLPGMRARGTGRILNVCSLYSFLPVPWQAVYGASKSFMLSFSLALASELHGSGITVTALCPGGTKTSFRRRAGVHDRGTGLSAEVVAAVGYAAMRAGKQVAVPGLVNRCFLGLARHLPATQLAPLMRIINSYRGVITRST